MYASILRIAVCLMIANSVHADQLAEFRKQLPTEPSYQTASPRYCLLVFGKDKAFRCWLVHDGDQFFLDRNGNGDLTDVGERAPEARSTDLGPVESPMKDRYRRLRVTADDDGTYQLRLDIANVGPQMIGFSKAVRPRFSTKPEDAPVIHFDGPMTLGQYGLPQTIPRDTDNHSYRVTSLKLMIGTPGVGAGSFAAYHCKCRREKTMKGTAAFATREKRPLIVGLDYQMKG